MKTWTSINDCFSLLFSSDFCKCFLDLFTSVFLFVPWNAGQLCIFIINTVNAGALAVTIDGPSKVQLSCREVEEGYEITYTQMAPGDYLITIEYAGNMQIPGSQFRARIEGETFKIFPDCEVKRADRLCIHMEQTLDAFGGNVRWHLKQTSDCIKLYFSCIYLILVDQWFYNTYYTFKTDVEINVR